MTLHNNILYLILNVQSYSYFKTSTSLQPRNKVPRQQPVWQRAFSARFDAIYTQLFTVYLGTLPLDSLPSNGQSLGLPTFEASSGSSAAPLAVLAEKFPTKSPQLWAYLRHIMHAARTTRDQPRLCTIELIISRLLSRVALIGPRSTLPYLTRPSWATQS